MQAARIKSNEDWLFSVKNLNVQLQDTHYLRRYFAAHQRLKMEGLNFKIAKKSITGLVGMKGCGQELLAYSLLGFIRPTVGQIIFDGVDISDFIMQDSHILHPEMQIAQASADALNPAWQVSEIVKLPLIISKQFKDLQQRFEQTLLRLQLSLDLAVKYPHELTREQYCYVCLAQAVIAEPKFLVIENLLADLDIVRQAKMIAILKNLHRELGINILILGHDISRLSALCSHIIIMQHGEIVEYGTVKQICNEPREVYTKSLLHSVLLPKTHHTA